MNGQRAQHRDGTAPPDLTVGSPHATAPPCRDLPGLVARTATVHPERTAVECDGSSFTYGELVDRVEQLARRLRSDGVRPGDRVGVLMPRGVGLPIALLGVLRAGAAYVPLDPDHPAGRITDLLADAGARYVVTDDGAAAPEGVSCVDWSAPAGDEYDAPLPSPHPDDLAYVIYTSGSTGRPKGVQITHAALVNFLWSMRERPGLDVGAPFPAVTTVTFDIAALELYLPLFLGGRVLISSPGQARDPARLAALLAHGNVRAMQATPTTWRMLLEWGWSPPAGFAVLCGGEPLPAELARGLASGGGPVWDLYGPTETTVWSSVGPVRDGAATATYAVANTSLHVLDERMRPVRPGATGELCIGGAGVAVGYHGQPRATAERFVPDPSGRGARLHRTGDTARLSGRRIEVLGRTDDQLKIRGHRVEPGEIETVLAAIPGVAAAVVRALPASHGERRLIAWVRGPGGLSGVPDEEALRAHCADRLPAHLVPERIVRLATFPTTDNNKVARNRLPAPEDVAPAAPAAEPGRTGTERALTAVWSALLGRPVGRAEDVFALGAHSLTATRAVADLRREHGLALDVTSSFARRTPAAMALDTVPAARPDPIPDAVRAVLSPVQRAMWLAHRADPDGLAYLEPHAVELPGAFEPGRLDAAVTRVVERHAVLRTRIVTGRDGEPVPVVDPAPAHTVPCSDGDAGELLDRELGSPIDLASSHPLRVRVARTPAGRHVLLLVVHHIATDDRSSQVLVEDLLAAYTGRVSPGPGLPYERWAAWAHDRWTADGVGWWVDRLSGLVPTALVPDRARDAAPDTAGDVVRFEVRASAGSALDALAAARGGTTFTARLAVLFVLLHRYTGAEDVGIGIPVSLRDRAELDRTVGMFVNTVVVRARVDPGGSFSDLLDRVGVAVRDAVAHADVPFDRVAHAVVAEATGGPTPLFTSMLTVHGPGTATAPRAPRGAKFELGLHLTEHSDGRVDGRIEFRTALFERATVADLAHRFTTLLGSAAADPDRAVRDLPMDTAVAASVPVRAPGAARWRPVAELVGTWSGSDRVAATDAAGSLTHGELDRAANRWAHHLRAVGIGRGDLVVVRLERSVELVAVLLGVWRAGAAYLPLDPSHPLDRLERACATPGVRAVVAPLDVPVAPGTPHVAPDDPTVPGRPDTPPAVETHADDLAYAVYTSGSTGAPKAAMVTHGGLAGYVRWALSHTPAAGGAPLHTSHAFDLALTALWPPLAAGGAVRMVEHSAAGVDGLVDVLHTTRVPFGILKLTPTHLGLLPGLTTEAAQCLVVGGEELRGEHLRGLPPDLPVINSYGPSETAVACCVHTTNAGAARPGPVPIGRPIEGAEVRIVDDRCREVPHGVPGEIVVGGAGVGRGYLADPRLTAERFVPDERVPDARIYRTGDLGRRVAGGELVFLGRRDGQMSVRGYRVEPGEVETALVDHPSVAACAVVLDDADPAAGRLVAHVVPVDGVVPDLIALRDHLSARLPEYAVPALWTVRDGLPMLRNGKIDRRALPRTGEPTTGPGRVAPSTVAEQVIAGIWAEVLGAGRDAAGVGVTDRFVDAGGNSLFAARIVARLGDAFGVRITAPELLRASTVTALADLVVARLQERIEALRAPAGDPAPAGVESPPVRDARADRTAPSPAQRQMWLADQLDPGGCGYLVTTALRLRGRLDVAALDSAVAGLVADLEILRTRYVPGPGGEPVRVVDPPVHTPLTVEDGDPAQVVKDELGTPIDLATGPVLRVRLVRTGGRGGDEHVLILTLHHIATDGRSTKVLLDRLAVRYGGGTPAKAVQYADVAARPVPAGDEHDRALRHWRALLDGAVPAALTGDRPRPAVPDGAGALLRRTIPAGVAARLEAVARTAGVTSFTVGLAGFLALLVRHGAGEDLTVGIPVSGRGRPETEDVVGYLVNPVAVRADVSGDPTFTRLVQRTQDAVAVATRHADLPFDRLVEELGLPRDGVRHPLFGIMFAYRDAPPRAPRMPGLEVGLEPVGSRTTKFDLTVELTREQAGGLRIDVEYATALYDEDTVGRLAHRFATLLGAVAADPHARIGDVALLEPAERAAVLVRGPHRDRDSDGLPELVARQARRTPDAPAVVSHGVVTTYAQLDAAGDRLAGHLAAAGATTERPVAVLLERGTDLVVTLLAVLRTGAAYLPMNPAHPVHRSAEILTDAGPAVLVVADHVPAGLDAPQVVRLERDRDVIDGRPAHVGPPTDPDAVAYVMYTSGSTGRPKGVAIPHRGIANRVAWAVEQLGLGPGDRVLAKTPITFDASAWELLAPLVSGGTVVLAPDGIERDSAALAGVVARTGTTVLQGVPSLLGPLSAERALAGCRSLRVICSAGEPLPGSLAAALSDGCGARVINTYGPTEFSIDATFHEVASVDGRAATVPIGTALPNSRTAVLDRSGSPVPPGVPGELYVAGEGLARGYRGRPGPTAERFVPDPHGPPGARAYRTGDVVRARADGVLEFLGRVDDQVKVRGVRVEPGEVEAVLRSHPAVTSAAVVARPGPDGGPRLIGFVIPAADVGDSGFDVAGLRAFLAERLPEAAVPAVLERLDAFPLTTSGKLDRGALPDVSPVVTGGTAPRTPLERSVTAVLSAVLDVDGLGIDDDFFALGGHSLLAVRAAGLLRAELGVPVSGPDVLRARTAAGLAGLLAGRPDRPATDGGSGPVPGPPVLSAEQQRLWLLHELDPGVAEYQVGWAFELYGPLDAEALDRALRGVAERHEVLRTRFRPSADGTPEAVVDPPGSPALTVHAASAQDRRDLVADVCGRPMDLTARPPLAADLFRRGPEDHLLVVTMHHIATDPRAEQIVAEALTEGYRAARAGHRPRHPRALAIYTDYARWQRDERERGAERADLEYWTRRLDGAVPTELVPDRPRPAVRDGRGRSVHRALPADVVAPLLALGRACGATPFATLYTAFAALLGRYTGSTDVSVGTVVSTRDRLEWVDVVGAFLNTVVLRTDLSGDPTPRELLTRVRDEVGGALVHARLPFDRLVAELAPERDPARSPLFQVMFGTRESAPQAAVALDGLEVVPVPVERRRARVDLTVLVRLSADGDHEVELEFADALFDTATVDRLCAHLCALAGSMGRQPDLPLSHQQMLPADERELVLRTWNPLLPAPRPECAAELVRAVARRTPRAVAVVGAEEILDHATLDVEADALARRLVRAGVGPEDPVAVLLDRSVAVVVAMLGVLRAGGVFTPVDPNQPPARSESLLAELRPAAVVVDDGPGEGGHPGVVPEGVPVLAARGPHSGDAVTLPAPDPGRLAYSIHTSGSSGRPKEVVVGHEALAHHCRTVIDLLDYGPSDRVMLFAPVPFDPAMEQIMAPLVAGGAVVIGERGVVDPAVLPDRIAATGTTQIAMAPAYFREMVAGLQHADRRLSGLRTLVVAGDASHHGDAARWFATGLPGRFVNLYGPTEATVFATAHEVDPVEAAARPAETGIPIGRPVPHACAYIVDDGLHPAAPGVPGEILLGGVRLARGYRGRPGLTASRFVPDPFGGRPGARLYRTGDVGRYRADGAIEFLGRVDAQIKIRGFRVEPGEIEATLAAHPLVAEAAVAVHGGAGRRRLAGYVVPHDPRHAPSPEDLREHLRARLPEHMVPAAFLTLDRLPRQDSQKLDRSQLPDPGAPAGRSVVAPEDEVQAAIAEAWAEVLGLDEVGVTERFFDIGGHSLLATRLGRALTERFDLRVPLRVLFEAPTVREQAVALEALAVAEAESAE